MLHIDFCNHEGIGDLIAANNGYQTNSVQKDGSCANNTHRHFLDLRVLVVNRSAMPAPDDLSARWALRWDDDGLHGRIEVTDAVLRNQDGRPYHNDGVEIYLDPDNAKTLGYQADDVQIRIIRGGSVSAERGTMPEGFSGTQQEVAGGYLVDFTLPLDVAISPGAFIGIDLHVIDNDNDRREHKIGWAAEDDNAYRSPASLGTVRLGG